MKGAHLDAIVGSVLQQLGLDSVSQHPVVAQHQHRPVAAGPVLELPGTKQQDHRLARADAAVQDPVPVAQRTGQLLLPEIEHVHQLGQARGPRRGDAQAVQRSRQRARDGMTIAARQRVGPDR